MKYKTGFFIRELSNRFKAEVLIEGIVNVCYVSSSCKLNKLIDLSRKEVILKELDKSRTGLKYSIIAVKQGKKFVIVNSNYANLAYENYLCKIYLYIFLICIFFSKNKTILFKIFLL